MLMAVHWKVKQLLAAYEITPYRLMKTSGLAQGTVYRLANNEAKGIDIETLDAVLKALRILTNEPIQIGDLLEFSEE